MVGLCHRNMEAKMKQKLIPVLISIICAACTTEPEAPDPSIMTLDGQVEERNMIVVYSRDCQSTCRVLYIIVEGIPIPSDLNVRGRPVRFQFKQMWEMRNRSNTYESQWAIKLISISLLPAQLP